MDHWIKQYRISFVTQNYNTLRCQKKRNLQQYMASDDVIINTAVMLQLFEEYNFLVLLLDSSNANAVEDLCQYINENCTYV